MKSRGGLHLVIGPVGAGKSTYGRKHAAQKSALFLDLDPWMVRLFGDDPRPTDNVIAWYLERRERVRALLWDTTLDVLATGTDVFLELGLVASAERNAYYQKARDEELSLTVHFADAPRDLRRQRVEKRNASADSQTQVVPMPFFERASDAWEPPTDEERREVEMIDV